MAADLTQYFLGPADTEMVIQAKACLWCDVGNGLYDIYGPGQIDFKGQLTKFDPGPFDLGLTIVDDTNCTINLNGQAYPATYTTDDNNGDNGEIVVTISEGSINVYQWHGGTRIDPSFSHDVWIGQDSALTRRERP